MSRNRIISSEKEMTNKMRMQRKIYNFYFAFSFCFVKIKGRKITTQIEMCAYEQGKCLFLFLCSLKKVL